MSDSPQPGSEYYVPPVVDETRDFHLGWQDAVFGFLTFPLLIWTFQYAFSGSEKIIATPRARMKLYMVLLAIEVAMAAIIWLVFIR